MSLCQERTLTTMRGSIGSRRRRSRMNSELLQSKDCHIPSSPSSSTSTWTTRGSAGDASTGKPDTTAEYSYGKLPFVYVYHNFMRTHYTVPKGGGRDRTGHTKVHLQSSIELNLLKVIMAIIFETYRSICKMHEASTDSTFVLQND